MNNFTIQEEFAISAGAGSGKTYTLSRRYINSYLGFDFFESAEGIDELKPADLDEIVTITFTKASAIEMKERIFDLINKILNFDSLDKNDSDYKSIQKAINNLTPTQKGYIQKRLLQAFQNYNDTIITTIHGFCTNIIKQYGDFIGVSNPKVIDDLDKKEIF